LTRRDPLGATPREFCEAVRRKRTDGAKCTLPAGWGTDHVGIGACKLHGGATPNAKKHAAAALVNDAARTLFGKTYVERPVDNPLAEFARLAGQSLAWLNVCREMTSDLASPRYAGYTSEQIRGEVLLWERAMDRCNTIFATYAKLNIDERLARITEAQAEMVMRALEAGLSVAGVTGEKQIEAKREAARVLRVVPAIESEAA
jgi:hypothetical protein